MTFIDPGNFLENEQRRANAAAALSVDDDPEQAARAIELGNASGVDPAAIYPDIEHFDNQQRVRLSQQVVAGSPKVQEYINSNPMAAKLSNDDYAKLAELSDQLEKISGQTSATGSFFRTAERGVAPALGSLPAAAAGASIGAAAGTAVFPGVGTIAGGFLGALGGGLASSYAIAKAQDWLASKLPPGWLKGTGFDPAQLALDASEHPTASFVGGMAPFLATMKPFGATIGQRAVSAGIGAGLEGGQEYATEGHVDWKNVGLATTAGAVFANPNFIGQKFLHLGEVIDPYLRAGKEPPVGLDKLVDDVKIEEAKSDADALKEVLKSAQDSTTYTRSKLRSLENFANFVRQHTDKKEIGIGPEAFRLLYGTDEPAPGDGKLGWIPRVNEQLKIAQATGGDVRVPMADFIAQIDPKVYGDISDHIRARDDGLTVDEAKKGIEVYHGSPYEFDAFDTGQIGTGEGAQSYGYGHYLAQNRQVGEDYKKTFEARQLPLNFGQRSALEHLNNAGGDRDKAIALAQQKAEEIRAQSVEPEVLRENDNGKSINTDLSVNGKSVFMTTNKETGETYIMGHRGAGDERKFASKELALADIKKANEDRADNQQGVIDVLKSDWQPPEIKANLYKATIHRHPDEFLDWDRPLSEQSPHIQEGLKSAFLKIFGDNASDQILRREFASGVLSGEDIYKGMSDRLPVAKVSEALAKEGIAGIKYLDQGSRGTDNIAALKSNIETNKNLIAQIEARGGQSEEMYKTLVSDLKAMEAEYEQVKNQTRNFVVFNDKDIEITHRNDQTTKLVENIRQAAGLHPIEPQPPEPAAAPASGKPGEQLSMPEMTRMEDREAFEKGAAIGLTADQYKRYQKLIAERIASDRTAAEARIVRDQRRSQTAEWKAAREELRPKVQAEFEAQPAYDLDQTLRDGRVKLDAAALTDEQRAKLPPEYVGSKGIHPDDLARLYSADSGASVVDELVRLVEARATAGMKPEAFNRRMIDAETDRRMEAEHGNLAKNIMEEAKDQVLSETQEEILHEQMLARASEAGLEFSLTKDEIKAALKAHFDATPVGQVSSDRYLADAGRAGRAERDALLKKDPVEAFRQSQMQYSSIQYARMARAHEKSLSQFERTAKRFSAREVASVDPEYTNWIHDILMRIGYPIKRSVQDLAEEISHGGMTDTKTLKDFVEHKESFGLREVPVADWVKDPNLNLTSGNRRFEDLSTAEFEELHSSIKALVKNGRDEKAIFKAGDKADLEDIKQKMLEQIQRFKEIEYDASGKPIQPFRRTRKLLRTALVSHLQVETVLNRLDKFDPKGVFSQYVFRPLAEAANYEAKLLKDYAGKLGAIADNADLTELIPNTLFTHPFKNQSGKPPSEQIPQLPMQLTRKNLRSIMLNWGNESNQFKMAKGYGLEVPQVQMWLNKYGTKADWDWAQKMWDMLAEFHEQSNTMYRNLSGVPPESLVIKPIQTPHGEYPGGYYPLMRHPNAAEDLRLSKNGLQEENYVRATTPAGYTKARTGAIYPLTLDLDMLPNVLRGMIHDLTFRPAVIQASKIFYDKQINAAIKKHLGEEYADMFVPYLRDVANVQNYRSGAAAEATKVMNFMLQNAVTTLVGLNPGTVMKHGPTAAFSSMAEVGPKNFLKAFASLASVNDATGETNWRFALNTSEELQRRMRNWIETLGGGQATLEGRTFGKALKQGDTGSAFMSLRETVAEYASKPVAISDLLSAVPTWMAKYENEMNEHGVHGDAVYAADKAVRQAHGSSAITSKSQVARARALAPFTTFFTFFNDLFNRQVETLWRAGEISGLVKDGDKAEAMRQAGKVFGRVFAYVILPAVIEELVTPLPDKDHESWGWKAGKALGFTLSSSWVGLRDIVNGALNHRDPSVGLLSTIYKSGTDTLRDFNAKKMNPANIIKHGSQLTGMLTGVSPAQVGRAAEFGYKVKTGQEHPKGPWGWMVGLRYGTTKDHSQTFKEWRP